MGRGHRARAREQELQLELVSQPPPLRCRRSAIWDQGSCGWGPFCMETMGQG